MTGLNWVLPDADILNGKTVRYLENLKGDMIVGDRPATVLETILIWSESRPEWQRDALRHIVAEGMPGEDGLGKLMDLCKKEHGDDTIATDPEPLAKIHLPVAPGDGETVNISSIQKVVGVNQLAPNQTLKFNVSGLTIIYGPNGSGKSGYSRVLKKACRARHAGEIMPDAFSPSANGKASADLSVVRAGGAPILVNWEDDGSPPAALSAITVFDRDSASVHVQKKNEVWFRPFGLDIPDDLAGVCQHLKEKLTKEKEALERLRDPVFGNPTWSKRSSIGKTLSALTIDTDLKPLVPERAFSEEDESRLAKLRADLVQDGTVAATAQQQHATRLSQLVTYLGQIETACSDSALESLFDLKSVALAARKAADTAATKAFSGLALEGVGEGTWKVLWDSARRYSATVGEKGVGFPPEEGDACVVCHQTIEAESAVRMKGFEAFIKDDTEASVVTAEEALERAVKVLVAVEIHVKKISQAWEFLKTDERMISRNVLSFIARARLRQCQALARITEGHETELTTLPASPIGAVEVVERSTRSYAASLAGIVGGEGHERLLDERAELEDLAQADSLIKIAETEVGRLAEVKRLDACIADTATTAITRLGNKIADDLITPRMRDRFTEEIVALAGSRVRVEIVRSGGKFGSPQYEVRLYANPKAKVHSVLSEGEQTCVALAAYLTELANATHQSALVFDDPVTSLDHKWRNKVAQRLVKEAHSRQIIVFTHDLILVNDMYQMAQDQSISFGLAHLSRGSVGVGIVNDGMPWRASRVQDRIDKLEKEARAAAKLYDAHDDEAYRSEVHGIYDRLRAAWERALEDIVFQGVILRHRDYINTKRLGRVTAFEKSDVETFDRGFKKCCDFVEAHDASRGRDSDPPEPLEVFLDIEALKVWSTNLRLKMNAVK